MEIRPLAHLLEDLLLDAQQADGEVQLAEALGVDLIDLEALREEYEQRYARAVEGVRELRGVPTFAGMVGDPDFPSGLRCEQATCWQGPKGMIYLGLAAYPSGFSLFGGARALPGGREQKTIQPPPS